MPAAARTMPMRWPSRGSSGQDQAKHYLCNLDADNILSAAATRLLSQDACALHCFVLQVTAASLACLRAQSHNCQCTEVQGLGPAGAFRCRGGEGTAGRIGMTAITFMRAGGYDEGMLGTGYQDNDLYQRVKSSPGGLCDPSCWWSLPISLPFRFAPSLAICCAYCTGASSLSLSLPLSPPLFIIVSLWCASCLCLLVSCI